MRNLGRHRVQVINPFDAAATLLQAAVRRLFAIINMPPEMIFDSFVGGWHPQLHQRTHDVNLGTLTELGLSAVTLQYKKLASRGSSSVDCRNPDYTGRPSTDFDR